MTSFRNQLPNETQPYNIANACHSTPKYGISLFYNDYSRKLQHKIEAYDYDQIMRHIWERVWELTRSECLKPVFSLLFFEWNQVKEEILSRIRIPNLEWVYIEIIIYNVTIIETLGDTAVAKVNSTRIDNRLLDDRNVL